MYAERIVDIDHVAALIEDPLHPYGKGAMGAVPSLDQEEERLAQFPGSMPRLASLPYGCAFHPRCPHQIEACERIRLLSSEIRDRRVACHVYGQSGRPQANES